MSEAERMVNRYKAFLNTLLHEDGSISGVVVRDNNGALVRWGINQASWPNVDVATLLLQDAISECYSKIWPSGLEQVQSQVIANAVYDIEFNNGRGNGVKLLQAAAGAVADGVIGPATIAAVAQHFDAVRSGLQAIIEEHYREIAEKNPGEARYLDNWLKRVEENFGG